MAAIERATLRAAGTPAVKPDTPAAGAPASPGFRPQSWRDLLWWFLDTMTWSRTCQVLVLASVLLALVFGGLGLVAHAVVGTSAFWSAITGITLGASPGAVTYGVARRRRRRLDDGAGNSEPSGPEARDGLTLPPGRR
ncbi:hypothetical protein ACQPZX_28760 [Actinoplanes sp. CA-142083]|uniref:hypothetical protein n=1 Tax=Actinoplanes sp. CA-142083 TaxID=3239903 RepID=UPI003D906F59